MAKTAELIDLHGKRKNDTRTKYLPVIKHAVPMCAECQDANAPSDWWRTCTHDPYFSWQDVVIPGEAVYEDIPNADGTPSTRKKLVSQGEPTTVKDRAPNLRESPVSSRHLAGGHLQDKWNRRGYKDVTHPDIGLKPFCQMRGCWTQDVKRYTTGVLADGIFACGDQHAQLLAADIDEQPLEVMNAKKRRKQLTGLAI